MMSGLAQGAAVEGAEGVPPFFVKEMLFPYVGGTAWIQARKKAGGWPAVDAAYARRPGPRPRSSTRNAPARRTFFSTPATARRPRAFPPECAFSTRTRSGSGCSERSSSARERRTPPRSRPSGRTIASSSSSRRSRSARAAAGRIRLAHARDVAGRGEAHRGGAGVALRPTGRPVRRHGDRRGRSRRGRPRPDRGRAPHAGEGPQFPAISFSAAGRKMKS